MPTTSLRAGDRTGPFELRLSPDLVRQFAKATLDASQAFRDGRLVPPSLVATQVYRAQFAAMKELVPERHLCRRHAAASTANMIFCSTVRSLRTRACIPSLRRTVLGLRETTSASPCVIRSSMIEANS